MANARPYIGIIGSGNAKKNVIEDGLSEFTDTHHFVLPWYGKPTTGLDRMYTVVIDGEHPYSICGNRVPRSLLKTAQDWDDSEPNMAVINMTRHAGGNIVLVLWDESEELKTAIKSAHSRGMRMLDLTNGLAPIIIQEETSDGSQFTEEELESMPTSALARQAKLLGHTVGKETERDALLEIVKEGLDDVSLLRRDADVASSKNLDEVIPAKVAQFLIKFHNGTVMELHASRELLNKIVDMVVADSEA